MSPEHTSTAIPDKEKTREELLSELQALRARNAVLEELESKAKRLETAVTANEEMFRATFEQSAVGMTHVSIDGRFLKANKKYRDITGYSEEELLDKSVADITYPADIRAENIQIKRLLAGETNSIAYDKRYIKKDGSLIWVRLTAAAVRDHGEPRYLIGIIDDITERKLVDKALRLTQFSIDRAADIALWVAPDGRFTYANEAACKAFGYTREEFSSLRAFDTNPYFNEKNWGIHWKEVKERGSYTFEARLRRKDGSFFPGEITVNYIVYEGKEYNCSFIRDITDRKRGEDALKNAKSQVELYLDLMGHDINNMNQISMGFLELAMGVIEKEGRLDKDNALLLDKAMGALKDSSRLIDNVRKLQRERMGEYRPELIDVSTMVEDGIKQFESVPGRNIEIISDITDNCHVLANGLLKDVFVNLIGNAIKHSRGDLEVKVRVRGTLDNGRKYCRVDIEDNGPGITDQLKATLFDRLNLTATQAKGKGFGLCLIKMLVDDYNGKFWVEDRIPGDYRKGAKFIVMLPAIEK